MIQALIQHFGDSSMQCVFVFIGDVHGAAENHNPAQVLLKFSSFLFDPGNPVSSLIGLKNGAITFWVENAEKLYQFKG